MLDHVTIGVTDLKRGQAFYDKALKPLGIRRLYGDGKYFAGYGVGEKAFFWIGTREGAQTSAHVAFTAAGGAENGARRAAALS